MVSQETVDRGTQEPGVLAMQARGVRVLTASGEDLTSTDDPAKIMMRQIAGAFAQYEKARLVAKLRGARDRHSAELGRRVEGRKSYGDTNAALVREMTLRPAILASRLVSSSVTPSAK